MAEAEHPAVARASTAAKVAVREMVVRVAAAVDPGGAAERLAASGEAAAAMGMASMASGADSWVAGMEVVAARLAKASMAV
eukprot:6707297-Prymnesium_polylepis.1